ncbi:methionyl-tRNA formyltransferase [Cytophagaceae bacterium AH-315-L13]|nr:methionyl-tRNA formyltransferase [Cytophagaceae bacterium AH-315-L13]
MNIVFLGTPDFAVASLSALVNSNYNVVGVVTAPDKPAGRGKKLSESAVKKYAVEKKLKLFQPEKLRDTDFINKLKELNPDIFVVVAFRMLPEAVWQIPKHGTFNLHASLLPQYRGAAPINWAIINGEKYTGITTFFINHQIDTGNIIYQEKVSIDNGETAGMLHDKLMNAGADLVVKTINAIEKGENPEVPQDAEKELKSAPKIYKEDCKVDWKNTVGNLNNFIRGLSPYPVAWTKLVHTENGFSKNLKIYSAHHEIARPNRPVGTIISDNKTNIKIVVQDGYVNLLEVQLEGRKRMETEEFLRGNDLTCYELG